MTVLLRTYRCGLRHLLVLAVALCAIAAQGQTVSGTVRDANTGSALRSTVVAAYTTSGLLQANTTTDTIGHYELALPAGHYRVLAYDPSGTYATQFTNDASSFEESPLTSVVAGSIVTINFALRPGGTVSGLVLTSAGLRAGLTVVAYNLSGTRRGFTTANGTGLYSLILRPGDYKLVAYDDAGAFTPTFFRDRTNFAQADIVTVTAGRTIAGIDFFLPSGARASGVVTDAAGVAIANVSLLAYSADGKFVSFVPTGADGRFVLTLPAGTYRFVAIDNSFTFAAGFLESATSFENSPAVTLREGQARTDLAFRLERGGLISGRVLGATSGAGIASITVAAYNADGTMRTFVTTDAAGKYVLLLPPGAFRIGAFDPALVYATQFYPEQKTFSASLPIAAAVGQSATLPPFTLSRGGRVTGTVIDQNTRAPIAGAIVQAYDSGGVVAGSTTTSAAGTYRIVLPAGSYRLVAADPQLRYAPAYNGGATSFDSATPVSVTVDTETTAAFGLVRGTLVIGNVVDASHQPITGVEVTALDLSQNRVASAITASDGSFRLTVVPGSYKFIVIDRSGQYMTAYFGGSSFATASVIAVDATGAPRLTLSVHGSSRRRAVHH